MGSKERGWGEGLELRLPGGKERSDRLAEGSAEAPRAVRGEGGPGRGSAGLGKGLGEKEAERGFRPASGYR